MLLDFDRLDLRSFNVDASVALEREVAALHFLVVHLALGEGDFVQALESVVTRQLLEDGPALLVALEILAVGAFANGWIARDAGLEALAVLLEAPAPLAAAALRVSVLALGAALRCRLQIGRRLLLLCGGPPRPLCLVDAEVLTAPEGLITRCIDRGDADGTLAHLRGARAL